MIVTHFIVLYSFLQILFLFNKIEMYNNTNNSILYCVCELNIILYNVFYIKTLL